MVAVLILTEAIRQLIEAGLKAQKPKRRAKGG
jgi:hypothetical protein